MIKRLSFVFVPTLLFLLINTTVLYLSFMNVKYTYEPALTGTEFDYLIGGVYSMAWLFYGVTNIAFVVIYLSALLMFNRVSRKHHV